MENTFEARYQQELEIRAAYEAAEAVDNEAGMEDARRAISRHSADIVDQGEAYGKIYREYRKSRDKGSEVLDLHDVIWEKEVESLVRCMKENGIERFTFSSTWSGSVEIAWLFRNNGCILIGMDLVYGDEDFWHAGQYKLIPAYVFQVN